MSATSRRNRAIGAMAKSLGETFAPVALFSGEKTMTKLVYNGHEIDSVDLPEVSINALLALGFSTKIKNSVAGLIPAILGKSKNDDAHWTDDDLASGMSEIEWEDDADLEGFAKAYAEYVQGKMFEAIVSGDLSAATARSPRASGPEKVFAQVAREMLKSFVESKGKKLPRNVKANPEKGIEASTAYTDLLAAFTERKRTEIQAEADRRIAEAKDVVDGGDDLLADLGLD
jgi:hypothetical protein